MNKEFIRGQYAKVIDKEDTRYGQIGIITENRGQFYTLPIEVEFPFPHGGILAYKEKDLELC